MGDAACIFCDITAGTAPRTLVYEDDETVVVRDIHPQAPVHILILPRRHTGEFMQMSAAHLSELLMTAQKMVTALHLVRYRILVNGGGLQDIDHVHVHVMGHTASPKTE